MTAHQVACATVIAALVASPQVVRAQAGWPGVAPTSAPKPAAAKTVAAAEVPRTESVPSKAPATVVKKPMLPAAKAGATPIPESQSMLQSLAELLTRQTVAIEALLRRLDAGEAAIAGAPIVTPAVDPAYAAPMPPVSASVAAVNAPTPATSKPVAELASSAPAAASQATLRPIAPRAAAPAGFARWGDVQGLNLAFRYRVIDNSAGIRTNHQGQTRTEFKGRVKFDRAGRYALNAGVFSGASNTSSWNNTGMGTGVPARDLHLKQFFFAAAPVNGLELQYGGIYVIRGESTEITTYDNDSYLTGQRITAKRPTQLWFDEISATVAYLGDGLTPDVWDRYHRLSEPNYYQFLLAKRVSKRLGVSADYTEVAGVPTWRGAFALKAPEMTVLDGVRVETYARSEAGPTTIGWALTADKKVGRTAMSGGFASIDEHYGGLNGDFYFRGNRWYGKATASLFPVLTVMGQYTHALDSDYVIANKERFDVVFTYDVLKALAPARR